ncbi:hypothetical protein [Microcoleus sp. F4-D5]|uniref:hypothetical protein n=1 Tax=Microcoleus sp. F4-D5 TaxID=2818760 RepID=UPI002FD6AE52
MSEAFNSQIYEQWKIKLGNDVAAIEQVMNHQHIDDILPGAQNASTDNLLYLGQALAQMWESRLKLVYPQRGFQVKCDRDGYTVVVTFFQEN